MDLNLIPLVNKIQDAFSKAQLPTMGLPQIAVVGSQSSGKSSVLEAIVGRDFLPRGTGIVTKRPLLLQLITESVPTTDSNKSLKQKATEYGVFGHEPNKKYFNFDDIRREIIAETDRFLGKESKDVSDEPIQLSLYGPQLPTLTLIDLPGATRFAVGDQSRNIAEQIEAMILKFISPETCLILAVSAANTDLANSDALMLARRVDPRLERTIGVLTKVDLMDAGTDCAAILRNEVIPMKNGFIGLVLRSQQDTTTGRPLSVSLEKEAQFFADHIAYSRIKDRQGVLYLRNKIRDALVEHIRNTSPQVIASLNKTLHSFANTFQQTYGQAWDAPISVTGVEKSHVGRLVHLLHSFADLFVSSMRGDGQVSFAQLHGPARIHYVLHHVYTENISSLAHESWLSDDEIRNVIRNVNGLRSGVFLPDATFEIILRRQIGLLRDPAIKALEMVTNEIDHVIRFTANKALGRYPKLMQLVIMQSKEVLDSFCVPAQDQLDDLVQMELSYINTKHPHFNVDYIRDMYGKSTMAHQEMAAQKDRRQGRSIHPENELLSCRVQGFLMKRGGTFKTLKKRWFRVYSRHCEFFTNETERQSLGSFSLLGLCVKEEKINEHLWTVELSRLDGEKLFRNHNVLQLEIHAVNEAPSVQEWLDAFRGKRNVVAPANQDSPWVRRVTLDSGDNFHAEHSISLPDLPANMNGSQVKESSDASDVAVVRQLLHAYFNIVLTNQVDMVPKTIVYKLVRRIEKELGPSLMGTLLSWVEKESGEWKIEELLEQGENQVRERNLLQQKCAKIKEAIQLLQTIRH